MLYVLQPPDYRTGYSVLIVTEIREAPTKLFGRRTSYKAMLLFLVFLLRRRSLHSFAARCQRLRRTLRGPLLVFLSGLFEIFIGDRILPKLAHLRSEALHFFPDSPQFTGVFKEQFLMNKPVIE